MVHTNFKNNSPVGECGKWVIVEGKNGGSPEITTFEFCVKFGGTVLRCFKTVAAAEKALKKMVQ